MRKEVFDGAENRGWHRRGSEVSVVISSIFVVICFVSLLSRELPAVCCVRARNEGAGIGTHIHKQTDCDMNLNLHFTASASAATAVVFVVVVLLPRWLRLLC